jgi:hypothetical protein
MQPSEVHVCLVSDQAAANLLPALDPALQPREVVLLVSAKMRGRADNLDAVLREAGVRTNRVDLPDEHDHAALEAALLEVASAREGQSIALNVTGGTKLMALAAQSVAAAAGWAVFYVDADTDEVIWLAPKPGRQRLSQQLRLRHYLRGYGFTLTAGVPRPHNERRYDDLLRTLVTRAGSQAQPLAQLNWIAQQAEDRRRLHVQLTEEQTDSRALAGLLRDFEEAGALHVDGRTLSFANDAARDFVKGGATYSRPWPRSRTASTCATTRLTWWWKMPAPSGTNSTSPFWPATVCSSSNARPGAWTARRRPRPTTPCSSSPRTAAASAGSAPAACWSATGRWARQSGAWRVR